jgi:hypothetical protein
MDAGFTQSLEALSAEDGVKGLVVADGEGSCIFSSGCGPRRSASHWRALLDHAGDLGLTGDLVVTVETDSKVIALNKNDTVTVAVYTENK